MPFSQKLPMIFVSFIGIYFVIVLHIYIPNMGGYGLKLPANIICWAVIACFVMTGTLSFFTSNVLRQHPSLSWFIFGALFLSLPLAWVGSPYREFSLIRIAGLWGGIALYWALLQIPLSKTKKRNVLMTLVISGLVEACIALWQIQIGSADNWMEFVPGGRPYGIFQQVNVLASFLSTAYSITLLFYITSLRKRIRIFSAFSMTFLTAVITILQSRIGYLACAVVLVIFLLQYSRSTRSAKWILFFTLSGLFIGILLLHQHWLSGQLNSVDKEGSNSERWLIMKTVVAMIWQHPISGWGYGSFEYQIARFAHVHADILHPYESLSAIPHAHNEFLFGWVEGGIVSAIGMITVAIGYIRPLKKDATGYIESCTISIWATTLPIALHLMTEYPLYQSAVHWLILIVLCRLVVAEQKISSNPASYRILPALIFIGAVVTFLFMAVGVKTGSVLTTFERTGMLDFTSARQLTNPFIQWERYQYDEHIHLLMKYNKFHDEQLLNDFSEWGLGYIKLHNDENIYHCLIMIANHQNNKILANQLTNDEYWLFQTTNINQQNPGRNKG